MADLPKTELDVAKVHSNGRIVIPSDVRKTLGIKDGDKMLWFKNIYDQLCLEKIEAGKPKGRYP